MKVTIEARNVCTIVWMCVSCRGLNRIAVCGGIKHGDLGSKRLNVFPAWFINFCSWRMQMAWVPRTCVVPTNVLISTTYKCAVLLLLRINKGEMNADRSAAHLPSRGAGKWIMADVKSPPCNDNSVFVSARVFVERLDASFYKC